MIKDSTPLEEFKEISGMTTRCYNVCVSARINTFGEFMDYIFTMNCRNMGKNTFQEIISLKSKYKELRMTDSECDIDWEQRRYEIAKNCCSRTTDWTNYRMIDMERKIGEIFEHNGEWYQCVEGLYCDNCAFVNDNCEDRERITLREKLTKQPTTGFCNSENRNDRKSVIFKKLEKVGEPYISSRNKKRYQLYRCFCLPIITKDRRIEIGDANWVGIEIKQTKEDMEEKKENVYIVYKHISPTGQEYVGMTRNIKKRWEGNGCSYNKNKEFRNDIMKYGWDNFQHIIIKDGLSLNEASKLEDELIVDAMDRGVAYNIARGGIGGSHPAWNKGVPLSEEQKEKLSAANKGKKLSDETKRKIGEAGRGRVFSEETRRKIGDKNRGKKHSKEHTEKWVKSNRWRFRKIEIRKNQELIGVFDSIHGAVRQTGLTQGFIYGILKSPKGKHQGYTIIILD